MNPQLAAGMVLLALLLGAIGVQTSRVHSLQVDVASEKTGRAKDQAAWATGAASAATANLNESARRVAAQGVNANAAAQYTAAAAVDATARRASAERLRNATVATAARCSPASADSAAAAVGAPASSPGDLLADLQRRMDEAAGRTIAFADAAHAAGQECVGDYDALTPGR